MNKHLFILLIILVICSFALSACQPKEHQHTFSDQWTSGEIYHWHNATCEHNNVVDNREEHTFGADNKCTVCGYNKGSLVSLKYILSSDGNSYGILGIGNVTASDIVIPNIHEGLPVTTVGNYAFENSANITSVTIPEGVTSVGDSAFKNCANLKTVILPNSLTSISDSSFLDCPKLTYNQHDNALYLGNETNKYLVLAKAKDTSITTCSIHADTKFIYTSAFYNCNNLQSIVVPNGVISINSGAFFNCSSLTNITLPNSITNIGGVAFKGCKSLQSITIPNGLGVIDNSTFYGCSNLQNVTIPNSVTKVDDYAFANCTNLLTVTLGENVTTIGYRSFENCSSLANIRIAEKLNDIGASAFSGCNTLADVYYAGSVESWNNIKIGVSGNNDLTNATIHYNQK